MGQLYTSLPLTDASTLKQKKNIEEPKGWLKKLQGLFTVNRDTLLKTVQGPFRWADLATNPCPAKIGVCYFVHALNFELRTVAADTSTGLSVGLTSNNITATLYVGLVPLVAQAVHICHVLDVLTDENTAVSPNNLTAAATIVSVNISYCEVPV